jgi:hypothetical protein
MRLPAALLLSAIAASAAAADFPAGSACAALGALDPVAGYAQLAKLPVASLAELQGQALTLRVDDPMADRWEAEALPFGRQRLMYRMGRNDVTEGWNWHPEATLTVEDYYRYKYLPLGQREADVAPPRVEPDPAYGSFQVAYRRRDAYYFAFDNPYDFYPRNDEDLGFVAEVPAAAVGAGGFHLVVRGRFAAPWRSESSTYWRAIPAQPIDLWLKNRYFMGRLETLWFCSDDGRILARLGK